MMGNYRVRFRGEGAATTLSSLPGDAAWIAGLLRHGLVRASFIPDRPQRELRGLTRYRVSLIHARSAEVNRLRKVLEGGNIKLAAVATDITGVAGRALRAALLAGHRDAAAMAPLACGQLRAKIPQLEQALVGLVGPHQRVTIARQLAHIDALDEIIAQVSAEGATRVRPFEEEVTQLDTVTGIGPRTAAALIAAVGVDMTRFPSADHLTASRGRGWPRATTRARASADAARRAKAVRGCAPS